MRRHRAHISALILLSLGISFWDGAVLSATKQKVNPMETLLKQQIADQRAKKLRAQQQAQNRSKKVKVRVRVKRITRPLYQILLIAGNGRKLWAHLILPSKPNDIIPVRRGTHLGGVYRVISVSEKGVVLGYKRRRWLLSFVPSSRLF